MSAQTSGAVTLEHDGIVHSGVWTITNKLITVTSPGLGSNTAELGKPVDRATARELSKGMLLKLITDKKPPSYRPDAWGSRKR